jgi:hypothetical protein
MIGLTHKFQQLNSILIELQRSDQWRRSYRSRDWIMERNWSTSLDVIAALRKLCEFRVNVAVIGANGTTGSGSRDGDGSAVIGRCRTGASGGSTF